MKLIMYFSLMLVSLIVTILFGRNQLKKSNNRLWRAFIKSFVLTVTILGLGSVCWFFTETDGISQGLGVLYYVVAIGVISVINIISLNLSRSKDI
jgi:hypothetical protein